MNRPILPPRLYLRWKFLAFAALAALLTIGGEVVLYHTAIAPRFAAIEDEQVRRNISRGEEALKREISYLNDVTADWAAWDDSYAFVRERDPAYVRSNLVNTTFENLKVNYILLFDAGGTMVAGRGYDFKNNRGLDIPEGLRARLTPGSFLLSHAGPESSVAGVLLLPENTLLLVSRPIITSERRGPVAGTLVMARLIDTGPAEELSRLTGLDIGLFRMDTTEIPPDVAEAGRALNAGGQETCIKTFGEGLIAGYTTVKDIYGRPTLVLRLRQEREVHRAQLATISVLGGYMTGLLVLATLTAAVLADRWLFRRLFRLAAVTQKIGENGDFSVRLPVTGSDELCRLAGNINIMLDTLERSQKE
ncbi:MAG: HAMP domain-containing protein, partial [Dehalococcoidia bacterium]|nr:HAMP domain-containing protein [Dehalococcoidia bacterium]